MRAAWPTATAQIYNQAQIHWRSYIFVYVEGLFSNDAYVSRVQLSRLSTLQIVNLPEPALTRSIGRIEALK